MSRVGKLPVLIPAGVEVAMKDDQISVKASANVLHLSRNALVNVVNEGGKLNFTGDGEASLVGEFAERRMESDIEDLTKPAVATALKQAVSTAVDKMTTAKLPDSPRRKGKKPKSK